MFSFLYFDQYTDHRYDIYRSNLKNGSQYVSHIGTQPYVWHVLMQKKDFHYLSPKFSLLITVILIQLIFKKYVIDLDLHLDFIEKGGKLKLFGKS